MNINDLGVKVPPDGDATGQSVSISTASARTGLQIGAKSALVVSDVACFVTYAPTPTATVAAGLPIPANFPMRIYGFDATDKLAFITRTGTGTVDIRPGA